jgi:hypothetical protein
MTLVILETPYTGDTETHTRHARLCVADSLKRGESPITSHLLYTQEGILDDTKLSERKKGIKAGLAWLRVADKQVIYTDNGVSYGMRLGIRYGRMIGIKQEYRSIL